METQIPTLIRPNIPNLPNQLLPQGNPSIMMGMRPGVNPMISPYTILPEQQEKRRQFAKSVYVSGFQKTVTTAMLERHFASVKPVHGIKLPLSKFNENKGFAFIYYGSEDDATLAKRELDRSVILKQKIRVTKTVVAENLSKMIFKMKVRGLNEKQIENVEKTYFNDENLQKQVERIIYPIFGKHVQVNKIIVPVAKKNNKPLTYARVFFYISNLKEAVGVVKRAPDSTEPNEKGDYQTVLSYIAELLNKEQKFSKYSSAEIYEYTKKNQANVLHLKGIEYKKGESLQSLADEIKEFIQKQNMQWQIVNSYAAHVEGKGAWANVTFATYEDTKKAYEHLKNARPQFREKPLYGSLRNVKDLRTVVFSVVRKDVDDKVVGKFLNDLAQSSPVVVPEGDQTPTRKYQFFSYNIIEQKSFFMDNEGQQVGKSLDQNIPESWRFNNTVPRRLVVHFFNDIDDQDLKTLLNDIRTNPKHTEIFMIDEKKSPLRANHQKGHIKNNSYVKHTEFNREKKKRVLANRERPQRQQRADNQNQQRGPTKQYHPNQPPSAPKLDFSQFAGKPNMGGVPKLTPGLNPTTGIKPQFGQLPLGGIGSIPPIGGKIPPMGMTQPPMGMNQAQMMGGKPLQMGQPMMGQPIMGQPMMGKSPIMGGNIPPQMGQKPNIPTNQPPKQ